MMAHTSGPTAHPTPKQLHQSLSQEPAHAEVVAEATTAAAEAPLTPASSSDESLYNNVEDATPPDSPPPQQTPSPTVSASKLEKLSLDRNACRVNQVPSASAASKRPASSERPRSEVRHGRVVSPGKAGRSSPKPSGRPPQRAAAAASHALATRKLQERRSGNPTAGPKKAIFAAQHRDSGYESGVPHREDAPGEELAGIVGDAVTTAEPMSIIDEQASVTQSHPPPPQSHPPPPPPQPPPGDRETSEESKDPHPKHRSRPAKEEYPTMIRQLNSSPITQPQLAEEVKGIYAGLVMVEAKCIAIDAAQAKDPKSQLGAEQWQALIALHRTLLYEHHDFLMATQHPSATPALRGLAMKYSMPARMWKHAIHAFLEVLRHRRPQSQDYMLAYIYLSYQMIALLFETVPAFVDTWIECAGDLARYRMAIEEDKEAHSTWGGVAARWYTMAANRHPSVGRLNHHLGILERPSLRKFFFYAKALTCVIPFPNARDSLATLCGPIVQDGQTMENSNHSAEARVVTYHAMQFSGCPPDVVGKMQADALSSLSQQPSAKLKDNGVPLVITNIAMLLELGLPTNSLWQIYCSSITDAIHSSRPSTNALGDLGAPSADALAFTYTPQTAAPTSLHDFCFASFDILIRHQTDRQSLRDVLPSVNVLLVWLRSLYLLGSHPHTAVAAAATAADHTCASLMERVPWAGLAEFMNALSHHDAAITENAFNHASEGDFVRPSLKQDCHPLWEDRFVRGMVWTKTYFPQNWFDEVEDEDGRLVAETEVMMKARVERVQGLALFLALRTSYIQFDTATKTFWAPAGNQAATSPTSPIQTHAAADLPTQRHGPQRTSPTPRPSRATPASSAPSSRAIYTPPSTAASDHRPKSTNTWAQVAAGRKKSSKRRQDYSAVKVVDEDSMQWVADGA